MDMSAGSETFGVTFIIFFSLVSLFILGVIGFMVYHFVRAGVDPEYRKRAIEANRYNRFNGSSLNDINNPGNPASPMYPDNSTNPGGPMGPGNL